MGKCPLPAALSWLVPEAPNIVVETVKQAEDGNGLVVRLYEAAGVSTGTALHCHFDVAAVEMTDLIEESPAPIETAGRDVALDFGPFEIRTLRLVPSGQRRVAH